MLKFELRFRDVCQLEGQFDNHGMQSRLRPVDRFEEYGMTGQSFQLNDVCLYWQRFIGSYDVEQMAEQGSVYVTMMNAGNMRYRVSEPMVDLPEGSALACRDPKHAQLRHGIETSGLRMSNAVIQRRLSILLDQNVTKLVEFEPVSVDQEKILQFSNFIRQFPQSGLGEMAIHFQNRTSILRDFIVDSFLLSYPHTYSDKLLDPTPMIAPRQVKRALSYIHDHPTEHVSADFLANLSGVSLRSLQYAFKAATGVTIGRYQQSLKLRLAREMVLHDKNISLQSIAEIWGFSSAAHFSLCFKNAYGAAPSTLRREK